MEGFRKLVHGWVGKVLLALFTVPFALMGIESYFTAQGSHAAARVNGTDITQPELDHEILTQRQKLLPQVHNDDSKIDTSKLHDIVLDNLINRLVLQQQAQKLGILPSYEQIANMIRQEPSLQENGVFSEKLFQVFLKQSGQDKNTLIQSLQVQTAISQLAGAISETALLGKKSLERLLALQNEKRHIALATLDPAAYAAQVSVSEPQITAYFQKNTASLNSTEQLTLHYITLNVADFVAKVQPADTDLQAAYQQSIATAQKNGQREAAHILIAVDHKTDAGTALKQAQDLEKRLQQGEDFAALAKQYSKDPGSAEQGGRLGIMPRGTFAPEFEATLDKLKIGETSAPVKTQYGYHIIRLISNTGNDIPTFESLRASLTNDVKQRKGLELYTDAVNKLNEAAASSKDLNALAKLYQVNVQSVPNFTRQGATGDLANAEVIKAAFSDDVMHDKRISNGISIDAQHSIWVQATDVQPSMPLTLAQAHDVIKTRLQQEQGLQLARTQAAKIAFAINQGQSTEQVEKSFNMHFNDMGTVTRMTAGSLAKPYVTVAFGLTPPAAGQWRAGVAEAEAKVAVLAVNNIIKGSVNDVPAEQLPQMQNALAAMQGQQQLQDYVAYLRSQAKLKVNVPERPQP